LNLGPHGPDPCVVKHYRGWMHRRLASDLLLTWHRWIESAKPRAIARREAETAICSPQLAALGIQKVGRGRNVSRVLYPLSRAATICLRRRLPGASSDRYPRA
jgi:hypothetical protein